MYKYITLIILLGITLYGCQSAKIKNETYKISDSSPDIGSIGESHSAFSIRNNFQVRTLPKLDNDIRIAIEIVPFNKKLHTIYKKKAKYNQNQTTVNYIDSIPNKPELITVKILDVTGFITELNAEYNSSIMQLAYNLGTIDVVSSIAACLTVDEITKIREADTYYLRNNQNKRLTVILYKLGKKTNEIIIDPAAIIGYRTSSLCWSLDTRKNWYIADMREDKYNCIGKTEAKINEKKKTKSLFDL